MAECGGGAGVWVAQQGSASVKLLHATTFITLTEVQIDGDLQIDIYYPGVLHRGRGQDADLL